MNFDSTLGKQLVSFFAQMLNQCLLPCTFFNQLIRRWSSVRRKFLLRYTMSVQAAKAMVADDCENAICTGAF